MRHSRIRGLVASLLMLSGFAIGRAGAQERTTVSLAQVRAEISRGQLDLAEKTLWDLLSKDPNQPDALTWLGIIRGREKRYAEAEALFRRALQLNSKSLLAGRNLAIALAAQGRPDEAIEQYRHLAELAPTDVDATLKLAELLLAEGQFNDALNTIDRIPKGQLPPEAIPAKAASLLGVGKRGEAAALISSVGTSTSLAGDLAEVFLNANAPDLALKTIHRASPIAQHNSTRLLLLRARGLQAEGDLTGALKGFGDVLAHDPKSFDALLGTASVQSAMGKHDESLASLKRAYVLRPESPDVLRPLIVEAISAGQPKTAVRAAHQLADRSPDNLDDQYLSAAALLEGHDYSSAASILGKYVIERPNEAKGFLGLGIAESAQQNYEQARAALERAIQIDPLLADAEYQLGLLADHQANAAESRRHLERAVQLQPTHANALAKLGEQYLAEDEMEKARAVLERSVAVTPNNPKAQYDLALALAKLGRSEEAKQHMELSRTLQAAEELGKKPPTTK